MLFVVAFGALGLGGILILFIARSSPDPNDNVAATARILAGGKAMPYDEFRALVIDLLEALRLEIVIEHGEATELDVIARSNDAVTGGGLLVLWVWWPPGDILDPSSMPPLAA